VIILIHKIRISECRKSEVGESFEIVRKEWKRRKRRGRKEEMIRWWRREREREGDD